MQIRALVSQLKPQELANVFWAFASLEHHDPATSSVLGEEKRLAAGSPPTQPMPTPSFLRLQQQPGSHPCLTRACGPPLLDPSCPAAARALRLAPLFKEQELSNIVWSLGRSHTHDPQLLGALLHEARTKLHHFMPQVRPGAPLWLMALSSSASLRRCILHVQLWLGSFH